MDGFKGFWGGMILGALIIAALTRFTVPIASDVANKIANRT